MQLNNISGFRFFLPRGRNSSCELFLAAVEILENAFRFVSELTTKRDGSRSGWGVDGPRKLFQYGDVLTIQKLQQLNPGVMKK
jgi:hypothetical protein